MGYRIEIDQSNCINCGICMDVCPVEALDMSRPIRPGIESGQGNDAPFPWMMEHPTQVGECIGCSICIRECPVVVMTLHEDAGVVPLAAAQGPVNRAEERHGWRPLSEVTSESLKRTHVSPWGDLFGWRTSARPEGWQTWKSMVPTEVTTAPGAELPAAPCQLACPAGTDAGRYVGLVGQGRYDEAYAVAAEVNPFPSVCGWICTAPCESACRRGVLDEPIAIRTLKRFAVEHGSLPAIPKPKVMHPERVAIVGGGPAGMSAAYYLARLGYSVTVYEAMPVPGGMMAIGIPEYRLPRETLNGEIERIVGLGVTLHLDSAMGRDFSLADLETQGFKAIFLATGASRSRRLGIDGEELEGVTPATLFLKRVNLGEGPRLSGHAVVVGGGSTAMDAARSALRSGATSVTVAYRRSREEMPAQLEEIEAAEREGIVIKPGVVPVGVVGREGVAVALRVQTRRLVAGPDGSATWETVDGTEAELPASTILVAIGEEPDPSILPEGAGIEVSGFAGIVADPRTLATGRAGIFAGGDVVSGPKTIIDAVASGRRAAGSIHEYLSGAHDGEAEIFAAVRYPTPPEATLTVSLASRPRTHAPLPMFEAGSFKANQVGFGESEARAEAGRCFRCDAVYGCPTVHVTSGRGPADLARFAIPAIVPPVASSATPIVTGSGGVR